jgi:hypothetical protein
LTKKDNFTPPQTQQQKISKTFGERASRIAGGRPQKESEKGSRENVLKTEGKRKFVHGILCLLFFF